MSGNQQFHCKHVAGVVYACLITILYFCWFLQPNFQRNKSTLWLLPGSTPTWVKTYKIVIMLWIFDFSFQRGIWLNNEASDGKYSFHLFSCNLHLILEVTNLGLVLPTSKVSLFIISVVFSPILKRNRRYWCLKWKVVCVGAHIFLRVQSIRNQSLVDRKEYTNDHINKHHKQHQKRNLSPFSPSPR